MRAYAMNQLFPGEGGCGGRDPSPAEQDDRGSFHCRSLGGFAQRPAPALVVPRVVNCAAATAGRGRIFRGCDRMQRSALWRVRHSYRESGIALLRIPARDSARTNAAQRSFSPQEGWLSWLNIMADNAFGSPDAPLPVTRGPVRFQPAHRRGRVILPAGGRAKGIDRCS